mmetsp:Transcript_16107/g.38660  ORF Transcript_16107/g.38660 Transcript_16107/m.38660 type:complete len:224 (+) Transcript_16107:487-1158(+)
MPNPGSLMARVYGMSFGRMDLYSRRPEVIRSLGGRGCPVVRRQLALRGLVSPPRTDERRKITRCRCRIRTGPPSWFWSCQEHDMDGWKYCRGVHRGDDDVHRPDDESRRSARQGRGNRRRVPWCERILRNDSAPVVALQDVFAKRTCVHQRKFFLQRYSLQGILPSTKQILRTSIILFWVPSILCGARVSCASGREALEIGMVFRICLDCQAFRYWNYQACTS